MILAQERQKASFSQTNLSHFLYGSAQKFEEFQRVARMVESDPELRFDPAFLHQSRPDMMLAIAKRFMRFHESFPLDGSNEVIKNTLFTHGVPFSLHSVMFLNVLRSLCDPEQEKRFLEPALRGEIIGAYAQTELAHGSDVQNLLTTATYDPATQSFIINTPEVGATKYWIAELAAYCNHAAVLAQLIINKKRYGVHAFIVPIRDRTTLKNFSGIQTGDIGPKHSFNLKDNGYAIFNSVRIPRRNMLMKYHVVSKEGQYSLQGDEKISYATMLMTRSALTSTIANCSAKITTIGTRYSILRTQFKDSNRKEIPVLDYQTQQEKIIPRIAESVAAFITARKIGELSIFVFEQAKQGKFERLNEAHILTSATKAILSSDMLRGAEIVRRSCGGHGFHLYNGIIPNQLEANTFYTAEGEFTVLMLQVGRFLLKSLGSLQKGKPLSESVQYFKQLAKGVFSAEVGESISPQLIEHILVLHSIGKIKAVAQKYAKLKGTHSLEEIESHHAGLLINDAAVAHSHVVVYSYFAREVEKAADQQVKAVLTKLLMLYGVERIIERASKFYETSTLSPQSMSLLFKHREQLMQQLRPQSLNIVEAFGYTDSILMSAIGASNGKPYENLLSWTTKHNSLNSKSERDQVIAAIRKAKGELRPRL